MKRKRRNAAEPPKSSEARYYLQALDAGQVTPAAVERKIAEVKEALDDARYFDKEPAAIAKLEDRVRELEAVLVWDQAASVERGLSAATEKPEPKQERPAALPVRRPEEAKEPEITVSDKTHDGFPLGKEDRSEITKLLRLARDGRISRTSITEALEEVAEKLRKTDRDKDEVQALRTRFVILDEALHLGKFALKNNPRDKKPIISKGWDGLYALVDGKGRPVSEGQKVKDYVIVGGRAPHKPDSSGRIWVPAGDDVREFFPTNVDLKWIHERDWKRNQKQNPYVMNMTCSVCGEGSAALTEKAMRAILSKPCYMCGGKMVYVGGQGGVPASFPPTMPRGWLAKPVSGHGLQNRPGRRNPDEDLRRLAREAKAGDAKALGVLERQALAGRSPDARAAWLEALQGTDRWGLRAEIVSAMARALFVDAWAEAEQEAWRQPGGPGRDLMDHAPETIPEAFDKAEELAAEFEQVNQKAFDVMYEEAAALPGKHYREPTAEDFGHYTAMQAIGHGVGWYDDHPDHGFKIPHVAWVIYPGDYGAEEPERCARCGAPLEQPGQPGFDEGDYCARCRSSGFDR